MVEAEVPPGGDGPVDEAPAGTTDETLEVPLKAPKRLPKPIRENVQAQTEALNAEIQTRKTRAQAINDLIARKRGGGQSREEDANRKHLNDLRARFNAVLAEKRGLGDRLTQITGERTRLRDETRQMRSKNAGIGAGIRIDDQIAELDKRLAHSSMPLNEEKKIMAEIERLKASRATSACYEELLKQIDGLDKEAESIREKIRQLSEQLDANKVQQEAVNAEFRVLKAKAAEKTADIPSLVAERDNCRDIMQKVYAKITELWAEFKEANLKYKEAEDAYHEWRKADKQRKDQAYKKEIAEKDAERQKEEAYVGGEWFHEQVDACDQLMAYLSKFHVSDAATGPAAAAASAEAATIDGYKVYKRKDEDADTLFGLSATKKGGKKGKKGADRKPDQPAEQKLVHSLDNLRAFTTLQVDVPLTSSQVPAALKLIQERKADYLEQRADKQAKNIPVPKKTHENGSTANGHAETSGKGLAMANGDAEIDLSPETVHSKLTVGKDNHVSVGFDIKGESFPELSAAKA